MNIETVNNLFSDHRLSNSALDFIENLKFLAHQIDAPEKFEIITYVNYNPDITKKIFNSYYEVGLCETFPIKESGKKSEEYNILTNINSQRKSIRKYNDIPVSYEKLGDFLKLFYSITGEEEITLRNDEKVTRKIRNIASGGGMYSGEIYIVNNKIEEIPKGMYRYNIYNSELELIRNFDENPEYFKAFDKAMLISSNPKGSIDHENTSFYIFYTSIINKHSFKYQDFGTLLSFIEIGELVHSAYLTASTLNLGCCAFGGFLNNRIHDLLDLKNPLHLPLMCMSVGNKQ